MYSVHTSTVVFSLLVLIKCSICSYDQSKTRAQSATAEETRSTAYDTKSYFLNNNFFLFLFVVMPTKFMYVSLPTAISPLYYTFERCQASVINVKVLRVRLHTVLHFFRLSFSSLSVAQSTH